MSQLDQGALFSNIFNFAKMGSSMGSMQQAKIFSGGPNIFFFFFLKRKVEKKIKGRNKLMITY